MFIRTYIHLRIRAGGCTFFVAQNEREQRMIVYLATREKLGESVIAPH